MTAADREDAPGFVAGIAWGAVAVVIWAGWLVFTTKGVHSALNATDLAIFRTLIPALCLAPLMWRERARIRAVGLVRGLLLACYGAPFVLLAGYGLSYAPVTHAGAMVPGLMPVFAAILGFVFLSERFSRARLIGFALIILAIVLIAADAGVFAAFTDVSKGHALFAAAALGWAIFTVTARPLGLSPYLSTGIVGFYSAIILIPIALVFRLTAMEDAPLGEIAFHAVWQGLLSGLASLYAYARAIRALGASQAAALAALVPFVAAAMAIPILGQTPSVVELLGIIIVGCGVYLATGAPLPPVLRRGLGPT